jgi:hypothetical protein
MLLIVVLVAVVVGFCIAEAVKDGHAKAKDRRDERITAAYQRQEETRFHVYRLAGIERTRRATAEELIRVAREAGGEIIEGTAQEIERR